MKKTGISVFTSAKEYLMLYQSTLKNLQELNAQLIELYYLLDLSGIDYSGLKVQKTREDQTAKAIALFVDLKNKILKEYADCINKLEQIIDIIERVENGVLKKILTYRYIRGYKWEDISNKMHYSQRHIGKLHNKGLKAVERLLKKEE